MTLLALANTTIGRFCILLFGSIILYRYIIRAEIYRDDTRFGEEYQCKPPKWTLPAKLPGGVDVVVAGLKAGRKKKLLGFMTEYFERTGPTIQIDLLGGKGFATMEPENIETVLSTKFDDFELGQRSLGFRALVGEGIFTQDGHAWRHSREILRHRFARMQYKDLRGFREHVDHLIHVLSQSTGVVDLQPHLYRLTLDTTIAMILGHPAENFRRETGDLFSKSFTRATLITATRVRLGDNYWLYAPKGFFAACKRVKTYTEQFIAAALDKDKTSEKPADADMDTLIHDLNNEYHDLSLVRDQVLNVLLAGRDTTATTISYVLRFLVRHTEVLTKLRREIEGVVGEEEEITRAQIQRMPYLQNVINETLRLRSPVPLNSRFCRKTTTLPLGGGEDGKSPILVRRGDAVAYSVFHMHRRTDIYGPDAMTFRPERWDASGLADIKWGFLPFNGGPRICLGKDFGQMLASYAIVRILQAFPKIRLPPGEPSSESEEERQDVGLVLSTPEGCKVILGEQYAISPSI